MKRKGLKCLTAVLCCAAVATVVQGCGSSSDGRIEIEIVQYKMEAANYFKTVEEEFNATHDDIHLTISSPNDATTILKTRFIRENYPDIIGIGGDINYSYFVDADILADVSGYEGMKDINEGYLEIAEALERHIKRAVNRSNDIKQAHYIRSYNQFGRPFRTARLYRRYVRSEICRL